MALLPCQMDMLSTLRAFENGKVYHCTHRRAAIYAPLPELAESILNLVCGDCPEK